MSGKKSLKAPLLNSFMILNSLSFAKESFTLSNLISSPSSIFSKESIVLHFFTTSSRIIDLVVFISNVSKTFLELALFAFPPASTSPRLNIPKKFNPNFAFADTSPSIELFFVSSLLNEIMLLIIIFIS
ncbi:hypothetical protein D3C86_1351420 [compost metagenome]